MMKIFTLCLLAVSVYGLPRYGPAPVKLVKLENVAKPTLKIRSYEPALKTRSYEPALKRLSYSPAAVKLVKVQKAEKPEPYEFSYDIKDDYENSQSRQEWGDEYGNMKGSYKIQLANGLSRWVQYVADEGGFRAIIETNEPGTDSQNPADVEMNANPVQIKEEPKKIVKKVLVAPSYGYGSY